MDFVDGVEIKLKSCHDCRKLYTLDQYQGSNGEIQKCLTCRLKQQCEHGRVRSDCQLCEGSLRCTHGKRKYTCSVCYNKLRCSHNRVDCTCIICHEEKRCPHDRLKMKCSRCNPNLLCVHNIGKHNCVTCTPNLLCEHDTLKYRCKICNPLGHLKHTMRIRVRNVLQTKKSKHTVDYLGCSVEFLKDHLERQFEPEMTWENHGAWHIDHIDHIKPLTPVNPISYDELISRFHYSNLQPLWARDNLVKGNRE